MHSHNVVGMEGVWAHGSHNLELFRAQDERKCVSKESANDIQSRCGGLVGKIVRCADESRRKQHRHTNESPFGPQKPRKDWRRDKNMDVYVRVPMGAGCTIDGSVCVCV